MNIHILFTVYSIVFNFPQLTPVFFFYLGIQTIEVFSYCSDVVCSEYYIISGHFDRKIRFWDSR